MMLYLHGLSPGNHTGYGQVKGMKSSAKEISALYQGLCQNYLTDFDVLLSGYAPSAAAVEAVGEIGMDLQRKSSKRPGSFFWGAFAIPVYPLHIFLSARSSGSSPLQPN